MTTTATVEQQDAPATPWWLVLIEGIALIIMGILFLTQPGMTSVVVVQLLGLYWIFAGILSIVKIFIDSYHWGWKLIAGIVGIIAGIIVIRHPLWSTVVLGNTLIILLGIAGIVIGIVNIVQAFRGAGWGTGILGVVSVILGFILLGNVMKLTISLPLTMGILAIIGGIAAIWGAFRMRSEEKQLAASEVPKVVEEPEPEPEQAATVEEVSAPEVEVEERSGAGLEAAVAAAAVTEEEPAEEVAETVEEVEEAAEEAVEGVAEPAFIPDTPGEKAKFHQELTYVEGIGPIYADALKKAGVSTTLDLLEAGATRKGRADLATQTNLSPKLILKWVNHVDLYRVPGIGSEYADLLEAAGVDTVPELSQRNAENLYNKMVEVNQEKKLVREVPGQSQVVKWVAAAKELPRKITY